MSMAFSPSEIRVLLVDHDSDNHSSLVDLLNYFSYEVTTVKLASTAISMLSKKGKTQFDIVIANINSPDMYGFKLLQDSVRMDLLVMLIVDNEDVATVTKGLEEGAFLCVQKPISVEIIKYLWQHILREKMHKLKANVKGYGERMAYNIVGFGEEDRGLGGYATHENGEEKYNLNGSSTSVERLVGKKEEECDEEYDGNYCFKRKVWTEWTEELHDKFVDAVVQLGEGRCYPKEILDLMNVPGLTRMQVASHLQKCRSGTWLPPNERKYKMGTSDQTSSPETLRAPRAKTRRFGSMPIVVNNPQDHRNIKENREKGIRVEEPISLNSSVGDSSTTSSNAEGCHPQDANGCHNSFSHVENNVGALNMWHIGLSLGMDDPYMSGQRLPYGDQAVLGQGVGINGLMSHQMDVADHVLEFRNGDLGVQNIPQELGISNYNGSLHALDLEQLYSMQMLIPNAHNGQWIHEE